MGQKTNPIGNRLGIIRGWDANWYGGKNCDEKLVEDNKIRKYLNTRLSKAGISKIFIERTRKIVTVTIFTARPGLIIGKGGMGERNAAACREFGTVHCVLPAGNAVVGAACVEKITGVEWLDLGMPEALWSMSVKGLGPLIVTIDTSGRNLFAEKKKMITIRKEEQIERISKKLESVL